MRPRVLGRLHLHHALANFLSVWHHLLLKFLQAFAALRSALIDLTSRILNLVQFGELSHMLATDVEPPDTHLIKQLD